jgi:hypothetical protein
MCEIACPGLQAHIPARSRVLYRCRLADVPNSDWVPAAGFDESLTATNAISAIEI